MVWVQLVGSMCGSGEGAYMQCVVCVVLPGHCTLNRCRQLCIDFPNSYLFYCQCAVDESFNFFGFCVCQKLTIDISCRPHTFCSNVHLALYSFTCFSDNYHPALFEASLRLPHLGGEYL